MAITSLQSRDDFTQAVLRKLGEPAIQVNVTIEQVQDCIDDALKLFYERHMEATEQVYILYNFTDADIDSGYVQLEPDIFEVQDVLIPNKSAGIFSVEYQLQLENLFSTSLVTNFGDLTYYYITQTYIALINRIFVPMRQFTYNLHTNKLIIAGGNKSTDNLAGGIIIKAKKIIYGDTGDIPGGDTTNNIVAPNLWNDKWLKAYAVALVQIQWGNNLSKFANVPLLGGVQMNGERILQDGKEAKIELEAELDSKYQLPVDFIIG